MDVKMVVCDLDGSLLNHNNQLSSYSISVIKKLLTKGYIFVVATGRNYYSSKQMIDILNLNNYNSYFIGSNGQQLFNFKEQLMEKERLINENQGQMIRSLLAKNKVNTFIFSDHKMYCSVNIFFKIGVKFRFLLDRINRAISDVGAANYVNVSSQAKIAGPLNKICFLTTNKGKAAKIKSALANDFDIVCLKDIWYEIMPKGINKGLMLKKIMVREKINKDQVMVFGDGENDISMMELVKHSYAMENAMDSVKKVCNYQVTSNKNDGIAKFLAQNLLND